MCRTAIFSTGDSRLVSAILGKSYPNIKVHCIVTNKPDSRVIDIAKQHNLKWACFDQNNYSNRIDHEQAVLSFLKVENVQFCIFAHYMRLITKYFVDQYSNRIINIHPSLLPAFKGAKGYQDAFNAGVNTSGCTIHYVDEGLDTGDIILQRSVPRLQSDTFEIFRNRVHQMECEAIQTVLHAVAV
ncbi:MAG TPA: phosphoribosylglycinamide formyltransferase [Candidatus Nanoarchaeia archaeon]|nr:phosphoribosylglycinamide formyltransferase [Candidatus Nanoarchaeia archaeon]